MSGPLTILWSGVDTLEASFKGHLECEIADALDAAKRKAQQDECPVPYSVAGYDMAVSARGLAPWPYLLRGEDLHLRAGTSAHLPTVSCRLLASGLVANGHEGLYRLASELARALGAGRALGLSRLDLAIDFQGWVPTVEEMRGAVCPATFRPIYPSLDNPQTFQFGRGDIVERIYNKTAEIRSSGKDGMQAVWALHPGYDPSKDVWRFEAQLRRSALRRLEGGPFTLPEVAFARLPDLLATGLAWCELRMPEGVNTGRWKLHPAWEALQEATFEGKPIPRVKELQHLASLGRLVPMLAGLLVSVGAITRVYRLPVAMDILRREVERHFERRKTHFGAEAARRRRERLGGT